MAKRTRKATPATETVDDPFSAATLRALATERRARERGLVEAWLPRFKTDVQDRVRIGAGCGYTTFHKDYDLHSLADACDAGGYAITKVQCLALAERLTDVLVASWFPGCRGATVMSDGNSIDIYIQL